MAEVFKIQRPLGGDLTHAYVYNKLRSKKFHIPMTTALSLFNGQELKVYWLGKVDSEGCFEAIKKVKQQAW